MKIIATGRTHAPSTNPIASGRTAVPITAANHAGLKCSITRSAPGTATIWLISGYLPSRSRTFENDGTGPCAARSHFSRSTSDISPSVG